MKTLEQQTTPMLEQYLAIKNNYHDSLLFYRLGDFYELFFEDAETASRELQITLTTRNSNAKHPVPMCGVPWHSAPTYIHQLTQKGYRVALCEQVEDARQAKGLVKREVTRIFTSATATEDISLSPKMHTYLGAIFWDEETTEGAFCWADVSTGFWTGIQVEKKEELWQWIQKIAPKELLIPESMTAPHHIAELMDIQLIALPNKSHFEYSRAKERLFASQNVTELEALGLKDLTALVQACGALIKYIEQTQMNTVAHLVPFKPLDNSKYLAIDDVTEKNLEIFKSIDGKRGVGTLIHIIDRTLTPMGGRLLEERLHHPWKHIDTIIENQNVVEWFVQNKNPIKNLQDTLRMVYDLERLSTRISLNRSLPKDLIALKNTLLLLPHIQKALLTPHDTAKYPTDHDINPTKLPPALMDIMINWDSMEDYTQMLNEALADTPPCTFSEGGIFQHGFNATLDEILTYIENGETMLSNLLLQEQTNHKIPKLKMGYNKVFGYYFELTKAAGSPPPHFTRRQTLANAERFTTEELKKLEEEILSATEKRINLEYTLFQNLREELTKVRPRIIDISKRIAQLDLWQALAHNAKEKQWVKPTITPTTTLYIKNGRHPVIEEIIGKSTFVPNDLIIDDEKKLLLITGPNMAGKSTILRQTAIICIMAQMGSFVPASEACIGVCDKIFSRVGASDNIAKGQSTFMVEMMETARILRQATERSLIILDEVGRGTSTFDGLALAWSIIEELTRKDKKIKTLFATHYHELTVLEKNIPGIKTMTIAIKQWKDDLIFLHKLIQGAADKSYGIAVAKLAGIPQQVIDRAQKRLEQLEKNHTNPAQNLQLSLIETKKEQNTHEEKKITSTPNHPLLDVLQTITPEILTPIEALNYLTEWKQKWGTS